jgi:hypothetical protein
MIEMKGYENGNGFWRKWKERLKYQGEKPCLNTYRRDR